MAADILKKIIDNKRREVEAAISLRPSLPQVEWSASRHSMSKELAKSETGIIAEFKRRSPSRGDIHPGALVTDVLPAYQRNGATACSILTDTPFFGGALTDLMTARSVSSLPLLRKDFIISDYQIHEAAVSGADAILLIAAALTAEEISHFTQSAHRYGLEVLLELHSMDELTSFCPCVDMVGVNNRNLKTFATDPELSLKLAAELPSDIVKVAESGLTSMDQVKRLRDAGYRGFLIGESFMKHSSPGEALHNFLIRKQ